MSRTTYEANRHATDGRSQTPRTSDRNFATMLPKVGKILLAILVVLLSPLILLIGLILSIPSD